MDKDQICFIRPRTIGGDYCFDGIQSMGYRILIPYKDTNYVFRILREICFRIPFLPRSFWFNKKILKTEAKVYIVKDPLMCKEFFDWLLQNKPDARILLDYDNMVKRSINPASVAERVEKWTYDIDDSKKYNLNLKHGGYLDCYAVTQEKSFDCDVLYLGRDKGRMNELLELENTFQQMGLRTYFHICADRAHLKYKSKNYKSIMPYTTYLERLKRSRAVLNVVQPNQTSLTMREFEAVFDNVKCITTNKGVFQSELYDASRYFVLGVDPLEKLPEFLETPFLRVEDALLDTYRFESYVAELVDADK